MTFISDKKTNFAEIHAILRSEHVEKSYLENKSSLDLFTRYVQYGIENIDQKKFNERHVEVFKKDLDAFEKCIHAENAKKDPRSIINRIISTVLSLFGIQTSGEKTLQACRISVQNARETHRKAIENCNKFLQRSKEVQKPDNNHSTSKPIKIISQSNHTSEKKEVNNSSNNSPTKTNNSPVTTNHQAKLPLENKVIAKKELSNEDKKFLQLIKAAISELDMGDTKNFGKKVSSIISALETLPKDIPTQELIIALNTLKDSNAFIKKPFEDEVIKKFITFSKKGNFATQYNETKDAALAQMAKSNLLNFIKRQNESGLNDLLSNTYNAKIDELTRTAIKNRLDTPNLAQSSPEIEKIVSNISITIKFLEKFEINYGKFVDEMTDKIHASYDAKSNGKFSSLIKKYDYCDLRAARTRIIEEEINEFIKLFSNPNLILKINQSKDVEKTLQSIYDEQLDDCKKMFIPLFNKIEKEKYDWILKNIPNIKKSDNQGIKSDTNVNGGTCFQNSLEEMYKLLNNPSMPSDKIGTDSTAKGRKIRAELKINPDKSFEQKDIEKFGVRPLHNKVILPSEKTTMGQRVVKGITEVNPSILSKCYGLFILKMYDEKSGHAFDVQYDHSSKLYRFRDDNFGICQWGSSEEFIREFQAYLNLFYPHYKECTIEFYELINKPTPLRQSK